MKTRYLTEIKFIDNNSDIKNSLVKLPIQTAMKSLITEKFQLTVDTINPKYAKRKINNFLKQYFNDVHRSAELIITKYEEFSNVSICRVNINPEFCKKLVNNNIEFECFVNEQLKSVWE